MLSGREAWLAFSLASSIKVNYFRPSFKMFLLHIYSLFLRCGLATQLLLSSSSHPPASSSQGLGLQAYATMSGFQMAHGTSL